MTINEALKILDDGVWWDYLDTYMSEKYRDELVEAIDTLENIIIEQQNTEKNTILTKDELSQMVGKAVYVQDLTVKSIPEQYYPASVFGWRVNNPYEDRLVMGRKQKITVVQPAAHCLQTRYWKIEDYGEKWIAYSKPPIN